MAQDDLGRRRGGGCSSAVSFRWRWQGEMRDEVDSNEVRRDALKVDEEDGDETLPALRSSARIFGYSSVLIRTFRDDRIPLRGSGASWLVVPSVLLLL